MHVPAETTLTGPPSLTNVYLSKRKGKGKKKKLEREHCVWGDMDNDVLVRRRCTLFFSLATIARRRVRQFYAAARRGLM